MRLHFGYRYIAGRAGKERDMAQKLCSVCGDDIASKKRVKDTRGNYYCEPCFAATRETNKQPATVGTGNAAMPASAPLSTPADGDGVLDLAPEREKPKEDANLFGCSGCKKLVPQRQIRNVDGEFICHSCFAKRNQPQRAASRPSAAKSSKEPKDYEETANAEGWSDSLLGGMTISAAVLALSFGIMFALNYWNGSGAGSILFSSLIAGVETLFLVFKTGGLLLSMIIAAQIMGGISFGYIGSAIYKSLSLFLVLAVINFFIGGPGLNMFGLGTSFIGFAIAFMALFRIDYFEAVILSVVNTLLSLGLAIGMLVATVALLSAAGHDAEMGPGRPGMRHVQPAMPGAVQPDAPMQNENQPAVEDKPADNAGAPGADNKPADNQ
jgi:hypothetical protein